MAESTDHPTENLTPLHKLQHAVLSERYGQVKRLYDEYPELEQYRGFTVDQLTDALTDEIIASR